MVAGRTPSAVVNLKDANVKDAVFHLALPSYALKCDGFSEPFPFALALTFGDTSPQDKCRGAKNRSWQGS